MSQSTTQSGRVMSPPPGPGRRCPAPAVQNGAAKLRKRGRRIKYKCYRGFTIVGPKQVAGTQFRHCQCEASQYQCQMYRQRQLLSTNRRR